MATRSGFEKHFPQAFEEFGFVTVFELLVQYMKEGRVKLDRSRFTGMATYHDPCNHGRKALRRFGHGFFEEPRWILDQCTENWIDLYPSRLDQICCGGGGGALVTGYDKERISYARRKMDQVRASGATTLVVPCHSCHGLFNNIKIEYGLSDLEVKYLWELVADCLIL